MESRDRLHEGQRRLQELLRRATRIAAASDGNTRYRKGFRVTLHEDVVDLPKRWRNPRLIFVNSMSDLFHAEVPLEFIQRVFATMRNAHSIHSRFSPSGASDCKPGREDRLAGERLDGGKR